MLKRLDHVNIVVNDLESAAVFFTRLGFQATAPAALSGAWISSIVGLLDVDARYVVLSHPGSSTNIELIAYDHPKASSRDPHIGIANQLGFRHLAFEVSDIEEEVRKLKASGVTFLSEVQTYPATGKKLAYFHGPEGILLELAEYPRAHQRSLTRI